MGIVEDKPYWLSIRVSLSVYWSRFVGCRVLASNHATETSAAAAPTIFILWLRLFQQGQLQRPRVLNLKHQPGHYLCP